MKGGWFYFPSHYDNKKSICKFGKQATTPSLGSVSIDQLATISIVSLIVNDVGLLLYQFLCLFALQSFKSESSGQNLSKTPSGLLQNPCRDLGIATETFKM